MLLAVMERAEDLINENSTYLLFHSVKLRRDECRNSCSSMVENEWDS